MHHSLKCPHISVVLGYISFFYHMRPFNKTTATLVRPHPISTLCTTPLGKMTLWNKVFVTDTGSLYRDFGCAELDCTLQFYKQEKRNSILSFIIKHDLFPITQAQPNHKNSWKSPLQIHYGVVVWFDSIQPLKNKINRRTNSFNCIPL